MDKICRRCYNERQYDERDELNKRCNKNNVKCSLEK